MDRFLGLLHHHRVQTVIDVGTAPASRYFPELQQQQPRPGAGTNTVNYIFVGAMLSGRPDLLAFYTLEGRADYRAMTSASMEGIDLVQKAPDACHRTLLVCSTSTT